MAACAVVQPPLLRQARCAGDALCSEDGQGGILVGSQSRAAPSQAGSRNLKCTSLALWLPSAPPVQLGRLQGNPPTFAPLPPHWAAQGWGQGWWELQLVFNRWLQGRQLGRGLWLAQQPWRASQRGTAGGWGGSECEAPPPPGHSLKLPLA